MEKYDLNTIRAVCDNFTVFTELWCGNAGGNEIIFLAPDEIVQYLEQGEDFLLKKIGIPAGKFDAWREWRDLDGDALCAATTKRGTLCRHTVSRNLDFWEWLQLHRDDYCALHGGEPG